MQVLVPTSLPEQNFVARTDTDRSSFTEKVVSCASFDFIPEASFSASTLRKKSRTKTFDWQESSIQNAMQLQTLIKFLSGAKLEAEFAVALHS